MADAGLDRNREISPEERQRLKKSMIRIVVFAIVAGLVLAFMGFLAGKKLKEERSDQSSSYSLVQRNEGSYV